MAFKGFLVTGLFCSVYILRCLGTFCDGEFPCSYYQVCCNDVCTTGSSCVGHRCITSKNCLSSESCCNSVCVKGDNCLGRKCDYDGQCLEPKERCCINKCTDSKSAGLCVDTFLFVMIIIACVGSFALTLGFILGGVLYLRRRKRIRAHLRGQVLAPPTEQPYQRFNNEEPEHNEATLQETLPPSLSASELGTSHELHETNTVNSKDFESTPEPTI